MLSALLFGILIVQLCELGRLEIDSLSAITNCGTDVYHLNFPQDKLILKIIGKSLSYSWFEHTIDRRLFLQFGWYFLESFSSRLSL